MQTLISTIIPVFNGERHLAATLDSAAQQTHQPHEIIVVDDGSTDGTAAVVQARPEVRYIHQTNRGHGAAKNAGIAVARGDCIAFLDADDVWAVDKLSAQLDYLTAHPQAQGVICLMETLLDDDMSFPAGLNAEHYRNTPAAYIPSAMLLRRAALDTVGWFDVRLRHSNDSDWFFRARDAGVTIGVVPRVLLKRRLHQGNLSHQAGAINSELLTVVRASLSRTRKPPQNT